MERAIGFNQFEQIPPDPLAIRGHRHIERGRVTDHTHPVPLEGEGDAVDHSHGGEHAPTGEQPDLSRREQRLGGGPNLAVVKKEGVQHRAILARWPGRPGLPR
jgi:hypothetical protein